jgi:hypothetical protein
MDPDLYLDKANRARYAGNHRLADALIEALKTHGLHVCEDESHCLECHQAALAREDRRSRAWEAKRL